MSKQNALFALYSEQAGKYWTGNLRQIERIGGGYPYYGKATTKVHDWKPSFNTSPDACCWLINRARELWKAYELERMSGTLVPELKLMRQEISYKAISGSINVKPIDVIKHRMMIANVGRDISKAFDKVVELYPKPEEACRYRYAFTRKGQKAVVEETFPRAISHGFATMLDSETDLVMARVVLADQFKNHHDLTEMFDLSFIKP